ncbi:MAG: DUF3995 domain-containing protein [Actinomycetota bacterium]|nr:DUF3995 domain-containing protein [Actinomycetota bacterium]
MGNAIVSRTGGAAALAMAWCAVFACAHLFWALGGSAGLASSAGTELAAARPTAFVLAGLWGVAGLLLAGVAVIYLAATADRGRRLRRLTGWVLGVIGAGLVLRGLAVEVLLMADAGVRSAAGPLETRWSLILWNPWFIIGGIVLGGAAGRVARRAGAGYGQMRPGGSADG